MIIFRSCSPATPSTSSPTPPAARCSICCSRGPRPVGELARETGLSQPNTSRHLRVLREAGLVERSAEGQRALYALRGEGFAEIARWLTPYVVLWRQGLKALEAHLEESDA